MNTIKQKSNELTKKLERFLDVVELMGIDHALDLMAPFMVFSFNDNPVYFTNKDSMIGFIVPFEEFDRNDWPDNNGIPFKHRIAFLSSKKYLKGTWQQLSVFDLCRMMDEKIIPLHPSYDMETLLK